MAPTARKIGVALLILGISLGTIAIGLDLDDCTAVLRPDSKQELFDSLAPAAEHTVGLALALPAVAMLPSRYLFSPGIEGLACNGCGYEPPVPRRRGPPLA